jgi:hypothetical protein
MREVERKRAMNDALCSAALRPTRCACGAVAMLWHEPQRQQRVRAAVQVQLWSSLNPCSATRLRSHSPCVLRGCAQWGQHSARHPGHHAV